MRKALGLVLVTLFLAGVFGCHPTYNVQKQSSNEITKEGTVVFVRPEKPWPFIGTKSMRDYIRVTHERAWRNDAGLLEVAVGLRNIGGQHIYDVKGPNFLLSVKTVFFEEPYNQGSQKAVPIYETNWKTIKMLRGTVTDYRTTCPKETGAYYQVVISEILKD